MWERYPPRNHRPRSRCTPPRRTAPLGWAQDFAYEEGFVWFDNMDRLIRGVNADGRVAVKYSTPATYAAAKARSLRLPARTDDMMPYVDSPHAGEPLGGASWCWWLTAGTQA